MSNIQCKLCGAKANSKCPYCRNIFPEDQITTMYSNLIELKKEEVPGDKWMDGVPRQQISLTITTHRRLEEKESAEDILLGLVKGLANLEHPEQVLCVHQWEFLPGEESSIGCGHGNKI